MCVLLLAKPLSIHNIFVISPPQTLQLDSPENAKLVIMASTIGIPSAPVLRVVSENFTVVSIFHILQMK